MSDIHESADALANQLARGIDPDPALGDSQALEASRARDAEEPGRLDASCVRAVYEAIAEAGMTNDVAGDVVALRSVRKGATAAADAARVADEIGAGAGQALRSAARAWLPFAVGDEGSAWRLGLRAFSEVCDAAEQSDQAVVVRGIAAAADAVDGNATATAADFRSFSAELGARVDAGDTLGAAWRAAASQSRAEGAEMVFQLVVDAVAGVLAD
ncbi:hypothetical protein [Sinomonas sp. G460-2]|uniref:hypothetical protein n=1 Tax=Sinomonas sp. G460-2 TaxID=3393464 RepID=UPI0039F14C32